jgi:hypothetical protein
MTAGLTTSEMLLAILIAECPAGEAMTQAQLRDRVNFRWSRIAPALQTLRQAGKVEWDRIALTPRMRLVQSDPAHLTLSEKMANEAREAGIRRAQARSAGSVVTAGNLSVRRQPLDGTELQALVLDSPQEAARALQARWGDLWPRLCAEAREVGARPLPYMVELLEAALDRECTA